jgi:hypothetical protein
MFSIVVKCISFNINLILDEIRFLIGALTLEKIIEIYIIIKFIRKLHYNLEYKWDLFFIYF